jgi:8-oxo-dGTP pyrophosphatase MutT (NUDIX family)
MVLTSLIDHLRLRLLQPLPGPEVQLSLLRAQSLQDYKVRLKSNEEISRSTESKQSSVLILLYEKDGRVFIPLIQRPQYDGVHSGQVSLPGGKVEPEDVDVVATALREAYEEIGVKSEQVRVLGTLTPVYIPPSRFWVNVVLGYTQDMPQFIPDVREVTSVIEFPLHHLEDQYAVEERSIAIASAWSQKVSGYRYEDYFIWGATSMILTELRQMIRRDAI